MAIAITLPLGAGLVALKPATGGAASTAIPEGVELAPLPKPVQRTVRTKSGAAIEARLWPGSEWTPGPSWWPDSEWPPAADEMVLIVCDSGDGVTVDPVVRMLRTMGATAVTFELPGASGKASVARTDAVHAMVTWARRQGATGGQTRPIHLFGVGKGADLALKVGLDRSDDVRTILLDSPGDLELLRRANEKTASKSREGAGVAGIRVIRAGSKAIGKATGGHVQLAPDSMTYPKQADLATLAQDARYQRSVAQALVPPKS